MDARAFLEMLWGDMPQSPGPLIQTWDLRTKRSSYWPHARGVVAAGDPDVFTGVALSLKRLGPGHRAKAHEVAAIAGLWLDLDIAPGKIPTRNDAFALSTACESPSIVIDSGYGLHCWYLFEKPWQFRTRDEQARAAIIAQQWVARHQQIAAGHDWHIDPVGDLARILRLPGTFNAKDPAKPRPVIALGMNPADGPRYSYSQLASHLRDMPIVERTPLAAAAVPGDASAFAAKLDALIDNSPEFAAVWTGERVFPSASERDLSACSLAAAAMNDAELAELIRRLRDGGKGDRADYVARTIQRARTKPERTALNDLARRAA